VERLGRWLCEAREAKGSTLEEAEAVTRIRAEFLELLEAGDFAAFPGGDVQVRGFLRIYARYLDLSPEDVLGRYSAEAHDLQPLIEATPAETPSELPASVDDLTAIRFRPRDIPMSSSLPRWMSVETVLIFGVVLIILLVILAIVAYVMNRPGVDQAFASASTTAPTEIAVPPTTSPMAVSPTPALPVNADRREVTLTLAATEHVQARVSCGARVVFDGLMAPGQAQTWSDDQTITVATGNGAGLQVTVNGQALGPMCGRGEVCTRTWGPTGEVSPP
jgi:cytoskeletal protein RodZ